MTWTEVPSARTTTDRALGPRWVAASLPIAMYARNLEHPRGWLLGWALPIAIGAAVIALASRRSAAAALLVAAAAVPGTALAAGAGEAAWKVAVTGAAAAALWTLPRQRRRPPQAASAPDRPTEWYAAVALLGSLLLVTTRQLRFGAPVLLAGVAFAVAVDVNPKLALRAGRPFRRVAAPFDRLALRASDAVGRLADAFTAVLRTLLAIPLACTALAVWAWNRIAGISSLSAPTTPESGWVERCGDDPAPQRYFSSAPADRSHAAPSLRWRPIAAAALLGALLVPAGARMLDLGDATTATTTATTAVRPERGRPPTRAVCRPEVPGAMVDQPDAVALLCEQQRALARGSFAAPAGYRLRDFSGRFIHLRDGTRDTWSAPPCDCRRVSVWWFGGSAAWGQDQSDDLTLASQFARVAADDGIAVDITNFATPTYTFGQEVHLFADQLGRRPKPDVVVFYNGGNDLVFQALRASKRRVGDESDITLLDQALSDVTRNGIPIDPARIEWTPAPQEVDGALSDEDALAVAVHTVGRYRRNLKLARDLSGGADVELVVAWQPLLAGSSAAAGPADAVPERLLASFTTMVNEARSRIPAGVIDLSGIFKEEPTEVFTDLFHTSERGAGIVARSLYRQSRSALASAAKGPPR